jgi:hypothetical protein
VHSTETECNAKIILGGDFTAVNGSVRNRIARLKADGALDSEFPPAGSNNTARVNSIAIQGDGIIVVGEFTQVNSVLRNRIARLFSGATWTDDGLLHDTYKAGPDIQFGPNGTVKTVAIQSNGQAVVGGEFTTYRVPGLTANGSLARIGGP